MSERRYTRQARLAEVGERGQALLCAAEATLVGEGVAGMIAARYAAGAGVLSPRVRAAEALTAGAAVDARMRAVTDPSLETAKVPAWLDLRDPAARDVARGAYEALVAIRALLAPGPS